MIIDADDKGRILVKCSPVHAGSVKRMPGAKWSPAKKIWYAKSSRAGCEYASRVLAPMATEITVSARALIEPKPVPVSRPFLPGYRCKTMPYEHQERGTAHIYGKPTTAVFAEPGTGKTKMYIDASSAMYIAGDIDQVLVFTPVSVRKSWSNQFTIHCPIPHRVYVLDTSNPLPPKSSNVLDVLVVGIESLSHKTSAAYPMCIEYVLRGKTACVVDESHLVKTHNSTRTERVTELAHRCVNRCVMTGTPVANSLVDLYAQFRVLDPDIIGYPDIYSFLDRYAVFGGYENRKIVGYENSEELMQAIEPYTFRARKHDCLDLPPKVYVSRETEMSKQQKSVYGKLKREKRVSNLDLTSSLQLALRLHQVAGGFIPIMSPDGVLERMEQIDSIPPKIRELMDLVAGTDESVIIWCAYRHEISAVVSALVDEYGEGSTVQIHGDVKEEDRNRSIELMQSKKARFLVGTASSGGVGITVTAATMVVYYSNTFKYTERYQSEDRAHRVGQTRSVTIVDLVCKDSVDSVVIDALQSKNDLATYVAQGHTDVLEW